MYIVHVHAYMCIKYTHCPCTFIYMYCSCIYVHALLCACLVVHKFVYSVLRILSVSQATAPPTPVDSPNLSQKTTHLSTSSSPSLSPAPTPREKSSSRKPFSKPVYIIYMDSYTCPFSKCVLLI